MRILKIFAICCAVLAGQTAARADTALIAVAANFSDAAKEIETAFEAGSDQRVDLTIGATGKLYAQIKEGAPFDMMLSADQKTPQKLEAEKLAVQDSSFTYGFGKLALYSSDAATLKDEDGAKFLAEAKFRSLAIANPELAPYGAAADAFLKSLFLKERVASRIVTGENIGQTFTMVQSGAADIGLVAYSQVLKEGTAGSFWLVPQSLYPPIKQDAVLLTHGAENAAAKAFLDFLKIDQALAIMKTHGYDR